HGDSYTNTQDILYEWGPDGALLKTFTMHSPATVIAGIAIDDMSDLYVATGSSLEQYVVDRDDDGIEDLVEVRGYQLGDRTGQLTLPGADPWRKDIYVEVDATEGNVDKDFSDSTRVIEAFANAPVGGTDSIRTGIALHIEIDRFDCPDPHFSLAEGDTTL